MPETTFDLPEPPTTGDPPSSMSRPIFLDLPSPLQPTGSFRTDLKPHLLSSPHRRSTKPGQTNHPAPSHLPAQFTNPPLFSHGLALDPATTTSPSPFPSPMKPLSPPVPPSIKSSSCVSFPVVIPSITNRPSSNRSPILLSLLPQSPVDLLWPAAAHRASWLEPSRHPSTVVSDLKTSRSVYLTTTPPRHRCIIRRRRRHAGAPSATTNRAAALPMPPPSSDPRGIL